MKILIAVFLLSLADVNPMVWCGYLQCKPNCDESVLVNGCQTCLCTCGDSSCMENYYCLHGIVSHDNPFAQPKCCDTTDNSSDSICLLPGERDLSKSLPHFP